MTGYASCVLIGVGRSKIADHIGYEGLEQGKQIAESIDVVVAGYRRTVHCLQEEVSYLIVFEDQQYSSC